MDAVWCVVGPRCWQFASLVLSLSRTSRLEFRYFFPISELSSVGSGEEFKIDGFSFFGFV